MWTDASTRDDRSRHSDVRDVHGSCDAGRARPVLRVHGVYRSALNLTGSDGQLITIALEAVGGLPHGILVHDVGDFRALAIAPGMTATMGDGSITIGRALRVDLSDARPWSATPLGWISSRGRVAPRCAPPGLRPAAPRRSGCGARRPRRPRCARRCDRRPRPLGRRGRCEPAHRPGPRADAVRRRRARRRRGGAARRGASLAGAVAGALHDLDDARPWCRPRCCDTRSAASSPERIHRLLDAILEPTTDRHGLTDAIRATVAWGATSGSDTLAGVLAGLDGATAASTSPRRAPVAA